MLTFIKIINQVKTTAKSKPDNNMLLEKIPVVKLPVIQLKTIVVEIKNI